MMDDDFDVYADLDSEETETEVVQRQVIVPRVSSASRLAGIAGAGNGTETSVGPARGASRVGAVGGVPDGVASPEKGPQTAPGTVGRGEAATVSDTVSDGSQAVPGAGTPFDAGVVFEDDELDDVPARPSQGTAEIVFDDDDEETGKVLTLEDKARIHADKMLATLLSEESALNGRRKFMFANAVPDLFRDEPYVLYSLMYRNKEGDYQIDREFAEIFFEQNLGMVDKAQHRIDINAYGAVDGSSALGYATGVLKYMDYLGTIEPLSEAEFQKSFDTYMLYYQSIEGASLLSDGMTILQDGLKTKSKRGLLAGFNDSKDYINTGLARIEGNLDRNKGTGFVTLRESILSPLENNKVELITDFGDIQELTDHYGGIYTGNLITVVGPPKAGKSKLTTRWAHNAIMSGQNVTIWPVEGGVSMWEAQIRAIHFDHTYNRGVTDPRQKKVGVTQKVILHSSYDKLGIADLASLEQASALDLVGNSDYGHVDLIDRPFTVDTFLTEIDTSVKRNSSRMVVIDYMQLIQPSNGQTKQQALSNAYPRLLEYAKKNGVAIVSPAQYAQEALKQGAKQGGMGNQELRVSVGESAEIVRSSDLVIALSGTADDLRNNTVWFESIPSRFAEPFERFSVYADLATCNFISINED